jgi:hypothetical protein
MSFFSKCEKREERKAVIPDLSSRQMLSIGKDARQSA